MWAIDIATVQHPGDVAYAIREPGRNKPPEILTYAFTPGARKPAWTLTNALRKVQRRPVVGHFLGSFCLCFVFLRLTNKQDAANGSIISVERISSTVGSMTRAGLTSVEVDLTALSSGQQATTCLPWCW